MSKHDKEFGPDQPMYFFCCSKWTEDVQAPMIATADNPQAQGQIIRQEFIINEVIATHPLFHSVRMSRIRQNFVILWAIQCRKDHYDWVVDRMPGGKHSNTNGTNPAKAEQEINNNTPIEESETEITGAPKKSNVISFEDRDKK